PPSLSVAGRLSLPASPPWTLTLRWSHPVWQPWTPVAAPFCAPLGTHLAASRSQLCTARSRFVLFHRGPPDSDRPRPHPLLLAHIQGFVFDRSPSYSGR